MFMLRFISELHVLWRVAYLLFYIIELESAHRRLPFWFYFYFMDFFSLPVFEMLPNIALEPTPVTPVSFRCGFWVGGSHRRRGSAFGRSA